MKNTSWEDSAQTWGSEAHSAPETQVKSGPKREKRLLNLVTAGQQVGGAKDAREEADDCTASHRRPLGPTTSLDRQPRASSPTQSKEAVASWSPSLSIHSSAEKRRKDA